jgi:hypothetical protein
VKRKKKVFQQLKKKYFIIRYNKMASELVSDELQYSPVVSNHSTIVYRNIAPQAGQAPTTSVSAVQGPTEFIIPPSVFCPAKSRIQFRATLPATAGQANYYNANTLTSFGRVVLYDSATNAVWADISNFEKYASLITPAATPIDEYLTKATAPVATIPATGAANSSLYPVEDIAKYNTLNTNDTGDNTDLATSNPYLGRRQFYVTALSSQMILDVSIPFSAFKFTALSTKKLVYCPSNLVLQIYWNANNNFAFTSGSVSDPTSGTSASLASAVTLSNVTVVLANEGNLSIVSQVIDKVMKSGLSFPIAYPTVTRQSISTSSAHSYQLQLTRGYGQRILAVVTAPFTSGGAPSTLNVHSRSTLTTYNTYINNVALKYQSGFAANPPIAGAVAGTDYMVGNKLYLEGSVIQNVAEYGLGEWVHIDSFFGEKPLCQVDQHQIDGLDVGSQSSTWQFVGATSADTSFIWITIILGQKMLSITNQGSMIV